MNYFITKRFTSLFFKVFIFFSVLQIQSLHAGMTLILDLDETVLSSAPIEQKENLHVQALNYKPGEKYYQHYEKGLKVKSMDPDKLIHFELHPETQNMTGYIVVRPGMEKLLATVTQDPSNQIYVASNSDWERTQAIVNQIKVGGKALKDWGVKAIPKDVFNPGGHSDGKKNLAVIRKWAHLPEGSRLIAIDDHPEIYSRESSQDHVIGITPWNHQNGILDYLSGASSQQIEELNVKHLNEILSQISKTEESVSSPPKTPTAFQIPAQTFDTSKSPALSSNDEYYSERPDISKINAQDHSTTLPRTWQSERQGHLEAVAELVEMYPDRHIYFLARDGELLYDYAKTALKDEPEQLNRIHLLNVSRANMRDANLLEYLAQEGISKENLEKGMKVMFVDTGFSGTIPKTISEKLPETLQSQLQTHLMSSANRSHPSSRVFLEHFHKGAAELDPSLLHSSIIDYEYMPRFTFRAGTLKVRNGRWEPTGEKGNDSDGQVSQEKAKEYMEDLKHFAMSDQGKERWNKQRVFWKKARQLLDSNQASELEALLKTLLNSKDESLNRAMVRDLLELIARNEPAKAKLLPTYKALGLTEIGVGVTYANKLKVIQEHPEWKTILENPATEIPKLMNGTDEEIQTLRNIIDEINDHEIVKIITNALSQAKETHFQKAAQTFGSILNNKPKWSFYLGSSFLHNTQRNKAIVEQALKSTNPDLRTKAVRSLMYYEGADPLSIFEKALTHEDKKVRKQAAISLNYWNPSDQKTLQMLLKILNHPTQEIRKEVADLIRFLYPHFHKEVEAAPFQSYITSDCQKPIQDVIKSDDIQETLKPILALLNQDNNKPNPIISIPKDDPRVPSVAFASLGEMYQVGGLIWSGYAKDEIGEPLIMPPWNPQDPDAPYDPKNPNATAYCKSIGGRLPTHTELDYLATAKGNQVPEKSYQPGPPFETPVGIMSSSVSPDVSGNPDRGKAYYLESKYGDVTIGLTYTELRVHCVK